MGNQAVWADLSRNVAGQLVGDEATRRWAAEGAAAARSWQLGADGEWSAAQGLAGLTRVSRWQQWQGRMARWWVLHSVPVGERGSDIDHVIGGPAGVFTINTKHHRTGRVDIVGDEVIVNRQPTKYVPKSVFEAKRAQRLIRDALAREGQPEVADRVKVRPILAVIGARLTGGGLPGGVLVSSPKSLPHRLGTMHEDLDDDQVAAVFEIARRSTTWI